jgi:4-diphosphocytidyl-2-C-methyl-D-erythritol kinase
VKSVTVRAPGKVNLQLSVGPVRADGFHDVATVYQAVDIADVIRVTPGTEGAGVTITMTGEGADALALDASNLAVQAAEALAVFHGISPDVDIVVEKALPVAGGMAGGSADAAGALVACDALWGTQTARSDLLDIAGALGSDVPFAVHGGTAIGSGRGEKLTPVLTRGSFSWVFALADEGLSTPQVYAECDRLRSGEFVSEPFVSDSLLMALRAGDAHLLAASLHNDLQDAAFVLRPNLAQLLDAGIELGALGGLVSGSGPTCAFLVQDSESALKIAVELMGTGLCRTVKRATGPAPGARITSSISV